MSFHESFCYLENILIYTNTTAPLVLFGFQFGGGATFGGSIWNIGTCCCGNTYSQIIDSGAYCSECGMHRDDIDPHESNLLMDYTPCVVNGARLDVFSNDRVQASHLLMYLAVDVTAKTDSERDQLLNDPELTATLLQQLKTFDLDVSANELHFFSTSTGEIIPMQSKELRHEEQSHAEQQRISTLIESLMMNVLEKTFFDKLLAYQEMMGVAPSVILTLCQETKAYRLENASVTQECLIKLANQLRDSGLPQSRLDDLARAVCSAGTA